MAVEIVFATGASVKVIADLGEVRDAIAGRTAIETNRFAGFRGDEAVGGERVVVSSPAIAYVMEIAGP
jgi:hypothetical protein